MRAFIAINFPEEVKEKLRKVQEKLPEFPGKETEIENLHLTLKFLGEIDEKSLENTRERLRKIDFKHFDAGITSSGIFDNRKSDEYKRKIIVWAGVGGCEELQKEVDNALGGLFEREKRFMGHVTLARAKDLPDKSTFLKKIEILKISKISFTVASFFLMESELTSQGAKYRTIEEYKLS